MQARLTHDRTPALGAPSRRAASCCPLLRERRAATVRRARGGLRTRRRQLGHCGVNGASFGCLSRCVPRKCQQTRAGEQER